MSTRPKAKRLHNYDPDYAVPPGDTLSEVIADLGMAQKDLAARTGLTEQTIIRILNGQQPISFETAGKLELVTGVPARLWNNLEMQYREQLTAVKQRGELSRDIGWLRSIPTVELIARKAIPATKDKSLLLQEVLRFYGVSSVASWRKIWRSPAVAARRSNCFETQPGPASAWIRLGELEARQTKCRPYDKKRFSKAIKKIRSLTTESAETIQKRMIEICAAAGVALALVPEMRKVPWNGATKWLSPSKAMILLSLRGKGEDIFWFSFFHEAQHVLRGKKQRLYIAEKNSDNPEEQKADHFAAETLIPSRHNSEIATACTNKDIKNIARDLGICPGIVAGRFRHLTGKWGYFKNLTRSFNWASGTNRP